jgi:hypothetical protein
MMFPEWENTKHYAYSVPYNNAGSGYMGAPDTALRVYPNAMSLLKVDDNTATKNQAALLDAVNRGNILLYDGWYKHPASDVVQQIYSQAK